MAVDIAQIHVYVCVCVYTHMYMYIKIKTGGALVQMLPHTLESQMGQQLVHEMELLSFQAVQ